MSFTSEQFLGILTLFLSAVFLFCSTWKRDHGLYRRLTREMTPLLGEAQLHRYYQIAAACGAILGVLAVLGYR